MKQTTKVSLLGIEGVKLGNLNSPIFDKNITPIVQPSETGEVLAQLEKDELDANRLSSMDTKANLKSIEVSYICAYDTLSAIGIIPSRLSILTRSKKRLSVSENRSGRDDYVNISSGKKEQDARMGTMGVSERIKGFFGGKT
jgi:hypothetical protein